jgi:hypothetical protein
MQTRCDHLWTVAGLALVVAVGACTGSVSTDEAGELYAVISEDIPTVVTATWPLPEGEYDEAWVEYGRGTLADGTAPATEDGSGRFEAVVFGLKPATDYWLQGVASTAGGQARSLTTEVTTGSVPSWLPELDKEVGDEEGLGARYLLTSLVSVPSAVVIIDADGDFVWWLAGFETDPPITRARMSVDGESILYLSSYPYSFEDEAGLARKLVRVSLDGVGTETILLEDIHHDFTELPDGTLGVLRRDTRTIGGGVQVAGDEVFEIHPDQSTSVVWSVWDEPEMGSVGVENLEAHATHGNALNYDAERGAYFVGSRNLHTVFEVDRDSGEVVTRYGGEYSDYVLPDAEDVMTTHQHQFQLLDEAILLFDNGENGAEQSRVVEYDLNPANGQAIPVWEYITDPPIFCYAMGDVTRTPDDTTLVTWATAGRIEEVDADGEVLRAYQLDIGAAFGYTTALDTLTGSAD